MSRKQAIERGSVGLDEIVDRLKEVLIVILEEPVQTYGEIRSLKRVHATPFLGRLVHRLRSRPITPPRPVMVSRQLQDHLILYQL